MALLSFSKSYFVAPFAYFLQEQVFFGIEIKYKFLQWLIIVLNVEVAICALNIIANNLTVFFYFLNFSWNIVSYFQVIVFKFLYHHHTIKIIKSTCNIISSNVWWSLPAGIYLFKVSNRNTRTRCELCSKLTIKTPKRRQGFLWFLVADSQDSKVLVWQCCWKISHSHHLIISYLQILKVVF